MSETSFRAELEKLINCQSMENGSNTPDYVLAAFLMNCLFAFDAATKARDLHRTGIAPASPSVPGPGPGFDARDYLAPWGYNKG